MNRPYWLVKFIIGRSLWQVLIWMQDQLTDYYRDIWETKDDVTQLQDDVKYLKSANLDNTKTLINVVTENDNLRAGIPGLLGHINILKKELKNALHKRQQRKTKKRSNRSTEKHR